MKIHISEATKLLIENKRYKLQERGKMEIKGKGEILTFFVTCKLDEHGREIKSPYMEVFENLKNKPPQNVLARNELQNESISKIVNDKKQVKSSDTPGKLSEKALTKEKNKSFKKELKHQDSIKESDIVKHNDPVSFTVSQLTDPTSSNIPNGIKKSVNNPDLSNTNFKLNSETMTSVKNIQDEFQNMKLNNNDIVKSEITVLSNNEIDYKNSNELKRKENSYNIDVNSSTLIKQNDFESRTSTNNVTPQEISFELNKSNSNYRSEDINQDINGNISSQSNQNKLLEMPKRSSFLSITCQLL